jgi:hypothetical protein
MTDSGDECKCTACTYEPKLANYRITIDLPVDIADVDGVGDEWWAVLHALQDHVNKPYGGMDNAPEFTYERCA